MSSTDAILSVSEQFSRRPVFNIRNGSSSGNGFVVTMRCPGCRNHVKFEGLQNVHDILQEGRGGQERFGQRRCSDPKCATHIFFVAKGSELVRTYPPELIDFDPKGIPGRILASLEEALTCHAAGCYTAAAIMIRKSLEELCDDRGALGDNLKKRIIDLGTKIILPVDLLEALHDVRLLGNDAAHLENKVYVEIGKAEVEAAIDLTKEILKATFQYTGLLHKLKALRKPEVG